MFHPSARVRRRKETNVETGTVKWFDEKKKYGFIVADNGGGEVFVRPEDVPQDSELKLAAGQKVQFEAVSTPSGNVAAKEIKAG